MCREAVIQEHEQKINRYQAILAARLKAKFFSKKAFDGGNIFEAETIVEGETIQSSRWPCTRSFANPEFFSRDKNSHEKGNSPSSAADSSAKNSSPPLAGFSWQNDELRGQSKPCNRLGFEAEVVFFKTKSKLLKYYQRSTEETKFTTASNPIHHIIFSGKHHSFGRNQS
ncbi:uncharacterized protein C2845_PM03G00650 [Panicum miliaceum]|uniref:Uncharacterized protein n=1 Tax=Panicum miliaceum TaxID=4540 RepID=A0A3L6T482_PANMI|nr:uncharacterized protein C2845_PM03G00650 [Panicum miliaceum]